MRISDWSSDVCSSDLTIESRAARDGNSRLSATFGGDDIDASLLQLLDLRFLSPDDSRFRNTLDVVEKALRRGSHMLRYATEDDFGLPETAFNFCTFWLIEALHLTGRDAAARALFAEMIARRTRAGLLDRKRVVLGKRVSGRF